ncbi:MAG TPA: hypothetical protein DCE81_04315 [Cytophagales bacterium]|nr:hypothetical protein [Cytophagales bacterium]
MKEIQTNTSGIAFEVPTDPKQRLQRVYDRVHMTSVDKSIHADELNLCNLFAIRFGYKREIVPELVNTIRGDIANGQSIPETLKRVQMLLD